jgi:predicted TPR repeat methyltransferase
MRIAAAASGTSAASAAAPPPLFIFSTEADLSSPQQDDPDHFKGAGFTLTGTGRVVHSRGHILSLCKAHGLKPMIDVTRMPIRQNAGKDVIGDLFVMTLE